MTENSVKAMKEAKIRHREEKRSISSHTLVPSFPGAQVHPGTLGVNKCCILIKKKKRKEMCLLGIVILKKKLHAVLGNEEMLKELNLPS